MNEVSKRPFHGCTTASHHLKFCSLLWPWLRFVPLPKRLTLRSKFVLSCAVDARWNHAAYAMTKSTDYVTGNSGNVISAKLGGRNKQTDLRKRTLPINDGSWRQISVHEAWLEGAIGYLSLFNDRFQPRSAKDEKPLYRTTALRMLIMTRVHGTPKIESNLSD